ncbi:helix-turn-helix transcriptional regulator, partial [Bordetella bronchiseptica]
MSQADRLRALMRWRGISSQNQLARISGVPQSTIHRILARGDAYAPTRATLERLARALHTTVPWLSDGMLGTSAAPAPAPPGLAQIVDQGLGGGVRARREQ